MEFKKPLPPTLPRRQPLPLPNGSGGLTEGHKRAQRQGSQKETVFFFLPYPPADAR